MTFYTQFKNVFDNVKSQISAKESIKEVVLGEPLRLGLLPVAVVSPEPADAEPTTATTAANVKPTFSVVVIVRESEPEDWFEQVIKVMGDVVDAVLADSTLGGSVRTCYLMQFSPGEVRLNNNLYYGGIVRFTAEYRFVKT